MDPITFIIMLIGINSTSPAQPHPVQEKKTVVVKQRTEPSKVEGSAKRRGGGWDAN